jgi:hypothetical protein
MITICFYNHWHNGDVFSGKAYMWNLMTQYPGFNYVYAVNTHPKTMADLRCPIIPVASLPECADWKIRGAHTEDTVYINTWFGVYRHEVSESGEVHANYVSLQRMWCNIYFKLSQLLGIRIKLDSHLLAGVAQTDWTCYQTELADKFVEQCEGRKINLFCNGSVRSEQSDVGDLQELINTLAHNYPDQVFVATQQFETTQSNVHFSNNIFQLDNDINEIAYLSTHCHMIVGKNSGPFMYCHVKDNMFDPAKKFWALSQRPSDSYAYGVCDIACEYYHSMSSQTEDLVRQFNQICFDSAIETAGIMQVLT